MKRRHFLKLGTCSVLATIFRKCTPKSTFINIAHPDYRQHWLSHPVIGDASFDSFKRYDNNPIYRGKPPYLWPVNGFLFNDPMSNNLYLYIGMYRRGYRPAGGCRLLRLKEKDTLWEDLGIVLSGSPTSFDGDGIKPGATPDVSVCYSDGLYHMIYDWSDPTFKEGGLGYAYAEKPEGPFTRTTTPINTESQNTLQLDMYKRVYGGTIFKRQHDWLVLAAMSTPMNNGGTWGLVSMTAKKPSGPYSAPKLQIYPQSKVFHPASVEFYPCFAHGDYIYVPSTSVANNRNFQIIYRARREDAHIPDAWEIFQHGSCWHAEPFEHESEGLWGQTYSGFVDKNGRFCVMFPSKDSQDIGTINLAYREWEKPYKSGFVVSAPNGPAMTIFQRNMNDFGLTAHLRSSGSKTIVWNHNAPIGPDRIWHADGNPHELSLLDCTEFSLEHDGWILRQKQLDGTIRILGRDTLPNSRKMTTDIIEITQQKGEMFIIINSKEIWRNQIESTSGSIGFIAEKQSVLWVDKLFVSSIGTSCSKFLLPTEAILGSALKKDTWKREDNDAYKYGFGYSTLKTGAMAKWNYRGEGFRLWSPSDSMLGSYSVFVDGKYIKDINQGTGETKKSSVIHESKNMMFGFHAVSLVQKNGKVSIDCLEVFV